MSAVDPNGTPVLVVGGGGGVSLPTDDVGAVFGGVAGGPALVGVDGSGDGVLMTAALTRSALTTTDPGAGAGWTSFASSGGTSTAWVDGVGVFTIPAGVAVANACGVHRSDGSHEDCDLYVRADLVSGEGGDRSNLSISVGTDANTRMAAVVEPDGTTVFGRLVAGSWTEIVQGSSLPSSGDRASGQLWLRLTRTDAIVVARWGVGSGGALPTSWTLIGRDSSASTLDAGAGGYRQIGCDSWLAGPSVDTTWHALTIAERALL